LVTKLLHCHGSEASGKLAGDTAEDACESAALTKFGATNTAGCGGCTNLAETGATAEALVDTNNNLIYCTSAGAAFGGEDTGNVPTDAPKGPISECENGVATWLG
jgi:hypothetical protein